MPFLPKDYPEQPLPGMPLAVPYGVPPRPVSTFLLCRATKHRAGQRPFIGPELEDLER